MDFCRKDDSFGVVVLYARRSLRKRRGVIHVCSTYAARLIWLEPFKRVGIEQHRATKRMCLGKPHHDFIGVGNSRFGQEPRSKCATFGGRRDDMRHDRKRLEAKDIGRKGLDLDVDEIRRAALMRQGSFNEP